MTTDTDLVFQEIANEIKGLHNRAIQCIEEKNFIDASIYYRKALIITEKIKFFEGMAITLFSMGNLALLVGDEKEALNNIADARDMFVKAEKPHENCNELLKKIVNSIKKKGVTLEKEGKYKEAIDCFETCIPFANEKNKEAMQHEVELLRRVLNGGQ